MASQHIWHEGFLHIQGGNSIEADEFLAYIRPFLHKLKLNTIFLQIFGLVWSLEMKEQKNSCSP